MDTLLLRMADKICSFEDILNRKLASFETQLQRLGHPAPLPEDEVGKDFEVVPFHQRDHISNPYSGLAPSEVSCRENVVLAQRPAPRTAEAGCSKGRRSLGLPER